MEFSSEFLTLTTLIVGMAFPLALFVAAARKKVCPPSMSKYYHHSSPLDDIYVGGLSVIGVCLLAWEQDGIARSLSTISGISLLATAFLPPRKQYAKQYSVLNTLHIAAAVIFLLTLVLIMIYFAIGASGEIVFVYIALLFVTIVFFAMAFLSKSGRATFWAETIAVWGFGFSWFAKTIELTR